MAPDANVGVEENFDCGFETEKKRTKKKKTCVNTVDPVQKIMKNSTRKKSFADSIFISE